MRRRRPSAPGSLQPLAHHHHHRYPSGPQADTKPKPKVVLAVLSTAGSDVSLLFHALKLSDSPPRSSGTLVVQWAAKAGIKLLEIEPTRQAQVWSNARPQMVELVAQPPSATRVVRVLARGENLDPDP